MHVGNAGYGLHMDGRWRARHPVRTVLRFIAAAIVGNYVVVTLSAGAGVVGALAATLLSGLSGLSAAALFIGVALMVMGIMSVAIRNLAPTSWLEPPASAQAPAATARDQAASEDEEVRSALHDVWAETQSNFTMLSDARTNGRYWDPQSTGLRTEAWTGRHSVFARFARYRDAHASSAAAHNEAVRIENLVRTRADTTGSDIIFVMNEDYLDRAIERCHDALTRLWAAISET